MPEPEYKIRLYAERRDLQDAFRVQLNNTALVKHKLKPGSPCFLQSLGGNGTVMAIAWTAAKQLDASVIQVSNAMLEMHDLKLSDRFQLQAADGSVQDARSVVLTPEEGPSDHGYAESVADWLLSIRRQYLDKLQYLAVGMTFKDVSLHSETQHFRVARIDPQASDADIMRLSPATTVCIKSPSEIEKELHAPPIILDDQDIGGLYMAIAKIRVLLKQYTPRFADSTEKWRNFPLPTGLLLYGPPGTGKSKLLRAIDQGDCRSFFVSLRRLAGEKGPAAYMELEKIFDVAQRASPSVILIDNLERLNQPREQRTLEVLVSVMENLKITQARVLVVAATSDHKGMDEQLRKSSFFEPQIEIPPPDTRARAEILKLMFRVPKTSPDALLDNLAERTHGFVGQDLELLAVAARSASQERVAADDDSGVAPEAEALGPPELVDYERALKEVKPSAMREVFLEVPKVRWADIGGQLAIKTALQQAVEWPLKYAHVLAAAGIEDAPKGALLYGPPGCSKTLMAKAIATEAGLNFLAVKGAEILSMYVGESERAVREVFGKARAAAPSILFFDEIDALGGARDAQHAGLNVLTTMLLEMDGIEALNGVFILAATNRPAALDPALMRPGRLDKHFYVGPPDRAAREDIFRLRLAKPTKAADVDLAWLADQSEGHSGSEVVNVCRNAGWFAAADAIESGRPVVISRRHLERALQEEKRQISPEMVGEYLAWGQSMAKA